MYNKLLAVFSGVFFISVILTVVRMGTLRQPSWSPLATPNPASHTSILTTLGCHCLGVSLSPHWTELWEGTARMSQSPLSPHYCLAQGQSEEDYLTAEKGQTSLLHPSCSSSSVIKTNTQTCEYKIQFWPEDLCDLEVGRALPMIGDDN